MRHETMPLVYIIVLTWNGKKDTLECLSSLEKISYPNARILVVDNASEDGTAEEIRRIFPNTEVIVNATNLRFAGGNNAGIRRGLEAGAEYVVLLNNDTTVDPQFVTQMVAAASEDPVIGMVGPKILYYGEPQRIWFAGGKIEWWKGWMSHIGIREVDHGQHNSVREVDFLTGCCMLVKREVIERVGMLDESYFIYGEDADWCVRGSRAGYKLQYVPSAVVWHKLSVSTGGHLSWFKNWNKLKSQLRLMCRYAKPYHWLTIPVGMVARILQSYVSITRRG